MTATQLAQALMDLAAEAGHDFPVVIGPDDSLQTVRNAWPITAVKIGGQLCQFTEQDDPGLPSKEVIHVY